VSERLVSAIAAQDEAAFAPYFADGAEFRAPRGLRERTGAGDTAALVVRSFGDSTGLELVEAETEDVDVGDAGRISRSDLLCSGFRPHVASA
jgi:hypothetical protein